MISNSLPHEEELLFSTPESLQQLHFDLLALAEEHQRTASVLPGEIQALHSALSADPAFRYPLDLLKEADFQLRERSACVVTLSQLAVRLIEGIRQQQAQHMQILERYQRQNELLREQNQCLAYRNRHIQTDVEYFREHLQSAESQLQQIANTQMEEEHGLESQKDIQIQHLEAELQRIKSELHYYRLSSPSRKSIHTTHLRANASELSIKQMNKQDGQLWALRQTVQMLSAENQGLRREIGSHMHSRKSLNLRSGIRQELCEQTERNGIEMPAFKRQNPSISNFQKEDLLRNTSKSLLSPRTPYQHEEAVLSQTPSLLEMRAHALSTEWSTKSFDLVQPRPKLIYLHEDEEEKQRRIQETKETEESVKEAQIKNFVNTGINTEPFTVDSLPQAQTFEIQPLFQKIISSFPLLEPISSKIIRDRIRRSTLRANKSLLMLSG